MTNPQASNRERKLSIGALIVLIIVYLVIVQGALTLATSGMDIEYGKFPDTETVVRALVIPVGASMVFALLVATVLGWWAPIWKDDRPVRRWVRIVPIVMVAAVIVGTNYSNLGDRGLTYTALFLIGALMVGFTEELMFRGIGVVAFRSNGFAEAKVALWTCVIFGLAHGTNLFTEGPKAFMQVVVTALAGYFLYLTRRVGAGILVAMIVHGLWDFGLFTGNLGNDLYALTAIFVLVDIVLGVTLLVCRRKIELPVAERSWT